QGAVVARGDPLEETLQLGQAEMGASAQSWAAAHHPAEFADPRIGLSTRRRLRQAPPSRRDTNALGEDVERRCRHGRLVAWRGSSELDPSALWPSDECNVARLTRLPRVRVVISDETWRP